VIAIGERLVYWTAQHPSWRPGANWPCEVGCVLYRHAEALVLIDPLVEEDRWAWLDDEVSRASTPVVVLLTAPWHLRSASETSARYDAPVWASEAGRTRLPELDRLQQLPAGIQAFEPGGVDEGQVAFFLEQERALVVAEFFMGSSAGLEVHASPATADVDAFGASLRELQRLPIERVLVAHGPPVLSEGSRHIAAAIQRFRES